MMEHVAQHTKPALALKRQQPFFSPLFVQPKLTIGPVDDSYEREADSVADRVMRMPASPSEQSFFQSTPLSLTPVQRKCAACEEEELQRKEEEKEPVQPKRVFETGIQRKCAGCEEEEKKSVQMKTDNDFQAQRTCSHCAEEEKLQMKAETGNSAGMTAPPLVNRTVNTVGHPLDPLTRGFMEVRFGYDFSKVRIHNDSIAHRSSADIHARAYTHGNHIVFGNGHYQPGTSSGKKLLAHELSHTIQQGSGSHIPTARRKLLLPSADTSSTIQREVEPESIMTASDVLTRIGKVESKYKDVAAKGGAKAANMARLGDLGFSEFNPGAPGAAGPTNAFVYTCRCGFIDMGHFFVSAAVAYAMSFIKQFDLRVNGTSYTIEQMLLKGVDKIEPELEMLINTVPGNQGKNILARVKELLKTGDPAAITMVLGYGTEFYQQLVKLFADRMQKPPKALEGEQRSAFTVEDLSSDCFGAYRGQEIWKRVDHPQKADDTTPIHDIVQKLFTDCKAVFPAEGSDVKCAMMEEITPGSCKHIPGKDIRGIPKQDQNREAPNLLASAKPLCGDPRPLLCEIGTGSDTPGEPLSQATLDINTRNKSISVILPAGSKGTAALGLEGTAIAVIKSDGTITGVGRKDIPGIGPADFSFHTDLDIANVIRGEVPHVGVGLSAGSLTLDAALSISYDGLQRLKDGPFKDEAAKFEEVFKSDDFKKLVLDLIHQKITIEEFSKGVKGLVKEKYPEGLRGAVERNLGIIILDIITHTKFDLSGVGMIEGFPAFYLLLQKRDPIKVQGYDAPIFRYAQAGLLFPQLLRNRSLKQFPAAAGYVEKWLIGDPRPGGPNLNFELSAGIGLPQAELFVGAEGSLTTDTGFKAGIGAYYAFHRFGSREPQKPINFFDARVPENFLKSPEWDQDTRTPPLSAYLTFGTDRRKLSITYSESPSGTKEFWLTFSGTHTIADSKGAGVK